jgi:hypothetical protein
MIGEMWMEFLYEERSGSSPSAIHMLTSYLEKMYMEEYGGLKSTDRKKAEVHLFIQRDRASAKIAMKLLKKMNRIEGFKYLVDRWSSWKIKYRKHPDDGWGEHNVVKVLSDLIEEEYKHLNPLEKMAARKYIEAKGGMINLLS